ncbi:MAG: acyltransferase, partial [Pedobacter sp.]
MLVKLIFCILIPRTKINDIRAQLNAEFSIPDFLHKNYLPSLDGWRAVAIILVILGHAKLTVSEGSFYYQFVETFIYAELGVRIFFVLSGFLITTLLIKEHINKGRINIKRFFIRRTLR